MTVMVLMITAPEPNSKSDNDLGWAAAGEMAQAMADPSEPTYCFCNRVSFGEMVACDNPDCRVEWFHFECVGLQADQARPKGKWYCPECVPLMKGGPKRKK